MKKCKLYFQKATWKEPDIVFQALYGDKKQTFWLDDNEWSYMGEASELIKFTISDNVLSISNESKSAAMNDAPFGFGGGFVGFIGYEGDARFLAADKFLAFNKDTKTLYLAGLFEDEEKAQSWFNKSKNFFGKIQSSNNMAMKQESNASKKQSPTLSFRLSRSRAQYMKDIEACKEYLLSGEAYQICLTTQFEVKKELDWLELYLNLRELNPAPYNAYINFGDHALLSSSPELFLNSDKYGKVISKPMKGTSRRGETPDEDKKLKNKLGKTAKDYAENAMIVDLVRNDLGRVCEIGSIEVVNPLSVETYKTVHQLVSTVRGKLRDDKTVIDAIRACFPGGSMTGAPKRRVMEIIAKLEKKPRGTYSGCFGYIGLNGATNLAMTIRTIVAESDKLTFGAGGAILIDSKPEEEYEEMLLKAAAMITAIMKITGAESYKFTY